MFEILVVSKFLLFENGRSFFIDKNGKQGRLTEKEGSVQLTSSLS
jgi:hypothetical protein